MLAQSLIEYSAQAGKGGGSVATIAFACLRVAQNKQRAID